MQLRDIIPAGVAALLLHELAHIAMALALKVKIHQVGVSWRGPYLRRDRGTAGRNLAITLAGPGANLWFALLFHRLSPSFALCNFVIGITNILPLPASDGARAVQLLAALRGAPSRSLSSGAQMLGAPDLELASVSSIPESGTNVDLDSEAA